MALPPESHRLRPDHLPTPFSADQIRDGFEVGRVISLREEEPDAEPGYRQIRFVQADAEGAIHAFTNTDADGVPIGPTVDRRSTWLQLQGHASQPADRTTCEEVTIELSWGPEPCWKYVVTEADRETRYWFAERMPGMPVVVESREHGRLTGRTEMLASSMVGSG